MRWENEKYKKINPGVSGSIFRLSGIFIFYASNRRKRGEERTENIVLS
jgi:hypothetical protein